jgi:site-specific recombinase XerD
MTNLPAVIDGTKTALQVSLETARENASRYALASKSPNSKRAYASDFKGFAEWCRLRKLEAIPADIESVVSFLADSANQGLKVSTIRRKATAISYFHRLRGHPAPSEHELVKAVLSGISREVGVAATRKSPITADVMRRLLRQIPVSKIGQRDKALLLLGFGGAFRRSELVALNVADLEPTEEGLIIHIRKSKTDQVGAGRIVAIPRGGKLGIIEALEAWMKSANIEQGRIFRSVSKSGIVGESLSDRSVANIVKEYATSAKLDPALFSGHSLRAGFVTSALDSGADAFAVMDVTGHKNPMTLKVYDRRSRFTKHAGRSFL